MMQHPKEMMVAMQLMARMQQFQMMATTFAAMEKASSTFADQSDD
jgi:hypothetical protein